MKIVNNYKKPTKQSELFVRQRQTQLGHFGKTLPPKQWAEQNLIRNKGRQILFDRNLKPIIEGLSKDALILQIGAGSCVVSAQIKRISDAKVISLDFSTNLLTKIAPIVINCLGVNVNEINRVVADWDHMPFKNEVFDLVVADAALHHAENLQTPLGEINRVMKKTAVLYVQNEPVVSRINSRVRKNKFAIDERKAGAIENVYTLNEWLNHFHESGFVVDDRLFNNIIEKYFKPNRNLTLKSNLKRLPLLPLSLFHITKTRRVWTFIFSIIPRYSFVFICMKNRVDNLLVG